MHNTTVSSPKAVVLRKEADRLTAFLGLHQPIETAVAAGRVTRSKVAESWLYYPSTISLDELIETARATADRLLDQRLVAPLSIMAGMVSHVMEPSCSKGSAQALLHHLVSVGCVARLGVLTADYEPYLAIYRRDDAEEISRQLAHVRDAMSAGCPVGHQHMPEPFRPRVGRGWAQTIIRHAEFAGWGRIGDGALQPWPRP
jgi:hypothetical protein